MFKSYNSKPIVREAYQLKGTDSIYTDIPQQTYTIGKRGIPFFSAEIPQAGGWVVRISEEDTYYCSDKVFRERNIVE